MRTALKSFVSAVSLGVALPAAALAGFGRFESGYTLCAQLAALLPGLAGDYLRSAFYYLTLEAFSLDSRVSFGSFVAHSDTRVEPHVYIGTYCVIGSAEIGSRTQIASHVQILSGPHQHARDGMGRILGSETGTFERTRIGADCWIGAGAIVMADVGERTTIGAGAVVTKEIPPQSVAVGNPARVIKSAQPTAPRSAAVA